jgi:protein involved in polysaccharide export with SLBB domain
METQRLAPVTAGFGRGPALRGLAVLAFSAAVLSGCTATPKRWTTWKPPAVSDPELSPKTPYRVGVGDVLRIEGGEYGTPVLATVEIDGCIHLEDRPGIAVDGRTMEEIESMLSADGRVAVEVERYGSKILHVVGVIGKGVPKAVAYQGPETIQEVINRVGCKECVHGYRVRVVRPGESIGSPPIIFSMEFDERGFDRDRGNKPLHLQPGDFVYVEKNIGRKGPITLLTDEQFLQSPTTWLKKLRLARSGALSVQ